MPCMRAPMAAASPAGPPPTTTRSKFSATYAPNASVIRDESADAPETRIWTLERIEASFTGHPKKGYQRPEHSVRRPRALSSARDLILMRMRFAVPRTAAVSQAQ